ncbi:nectin-2 isoform X2 [Misgurnus anguillicaudatus]|uniref:nectin-2 isoform X2 n=1 Tax=Misgurnus anguillicaudatus TaxID=75329 RepID=UPI003CCF87A1
MFRNSLSHVWQGSLAQRVRVEPEVVSYPGQTVTLRCQFQDRGNTKLTQVAWIFEPTDGERTNIAVFHPQFGIQYPTKSPVAGRAGFVLKLPTLDNPSIQIKDLKMTDEGQYICEYATYPSGNVQGASSLIMLAKPRNMATTVTVTAGNTPVIVACCESSNGRPAATISWSTTLNGNATTPQTTNNPDNTVTIQSEYMLAPQSTDNGKDITCIVSHRTMPQPETFPMKLVVEREGPPPPECLNSTKIVQDLLGVDSSVLAGIPEGLESKAEPEEHHNTELSQQSQEKQFQHRKNASSTPNKAAAKKTQISSSAVTREEVLELQMEVLQLQKIKLQLEIEKLKKEKENQYLYHIILNNKLLPLQSEGKITSTSIDE